MRPTTIRSRRRSRPASRSVASACSTSGTDARGEHGKLGSGFAIGVGGSGAYGKGGDGAPRVGLVLDGETGGTGTTRGGAGGGGAGRIRIENRSGSIAVPADGTVSPAIATGPTAATTVGVLGTK
ncbi:MAG: hypothetical protein KF819_30335 [Labilithrix sp.]|nr:hypothetical protein [Labilithrix sp.]